MLTSLHLHMKSSEVCIKTRSPPASLPTQGQVTKDTTVKWSIREVNFGYFSLALKQGLKVKHRTKLLQIKILLYFISNFEGVKLVNCNTYLMKVFFKTCLFLETTTSTIKRFAIRERNKHSCDSPDYSTGLKSPLTCCAKNKGEH